MRDTWDEELVQAALVGEREGHFRTQKLREKEARAVACMAISEREGRLEAVGEIAVLRGRLGELEALLGEMSGIAHYLSCPTMGYPGTGITPEEFARMHVSAENARMALATCIRLGGELDRALRTHPDYDAWRQAVAVAREGRTERA